MFPSDFSEVEHARSTIVLEELDAERLFNGDFDVFLPQNNLGLLVKLQS